jgi:hypothetical protein
VCDRLTSLSGTVSEFFGFTEISFPSYEIGLWDGTRPQGQCTFHDEDQTCAPDEYCRRGTCQPCMVPEPQVLEAAILNSDSELEKLESGLVRIEQFRIPNKFGPGIAAVTSDAPPYTFDFMPNGVPSSNCDLNQDGVLNFFDPREGACSNACALDADCTDWIGFASRGNYKVSRGNSDSCAFGSPAGAQCIMANTSTAGNFTPLASRGRSLPWLVGTLRHFSGGSLNWTVETRCEDDLCAIADCATTTVPASQACKTPPTEDDNDAATN